MLKLCEVSVKSSFICGVLCCPAQVVEADSGGREREKGKFKEEGLRWWWIIFNNLDV
jgi:hypothetical protein